MKRLFKVLLIGSFVSLSAMGPAMAASSHATGIQPVQYHDRGDYRDFNRRSDSWIHDRVHEALRRELGRDADNIRVDVRNGDVYLSGTVGSREEKRAAHSVAHSVRGVDQVFARNLEVGYSRDNRSFGYYPR